MGNKRCIKERMQESQEIEMNDEDEDDQNMPLIASYVGINIERPIRLRKILDHCNFTGKYRGWACSICSSILCHTNFNLPVFFIT